MLAAVGEAADHGVWTAGRCELADLPVPPYHGAVGREVEILTRERDPIAAANAERADDIGFPVAGRIAQQAHAAAPARDGDEYVAVLEHDHMTRGADRLGDQQRAESRGQRQSRIVRGADGLPDLCRRKQQQRYA